MFQILRELLLRDLATNFTGRRKALKARDNEAQGEGRAAAETLGQEEEYDSPSRAEQVFERLLF